MHAITEATLTGDNYAFEFWILIYRIGIYIADKIKNGKKNDMTVIHLINHVMLCAKNKINRIFFHIIDVA